MWSLLISLMLLSPTTTSSEVDETHEFHVSRLTANYIPDEGRIECTLMTFVDDVESVLAAHHQLDEEGALGATMPSKERLNLTEPDEHAAVDSLVKAYLRDVLQFSSLTLNQPLKISYLGKERDDDPFGMFIYFYVEGVPPRAKHEVPRASTGLTQKLELQSSYMLELYEDQQNVVVWKLNGESADYDLLTYSTRLCDFER